MMIQRNGDDPRIYRRMYRGEGTVTAEWYFRETTRLGAHVMMYTLAPGTSEGLHLHAEQDPDSCSIDDADELYIVTRGSVVLTVDGEQVQLAEGDAGYAHVGSLHGVANTTDEVARLMLVWGSPADRIENEEEESR